MRQIMFAVMIGLGVSGDVTWAQSNIDPDHDTAWGENVGWTNWRHDVPDADNGVRVEDTSLSGFIWSENVGWIHVGDGTPANGQHYANLDGSDFGVNIDPATGNLFGLAWSENAGWINFDTAAALGPFGQQARFDTSSDRFLGYVWGENIGWINLDDPNHFVAVESLCLGDFNGDETVGAADLAVLLGQWGPCSGCPADLNGDDIVSAEDLAQLLGSWGACESG